MRAAVVGVVCLGGLAWAVPPPPPPPVVIPATGAVVARNTKIWLFNGTFGAKADLYDSNSGMLVLVTPTRIVIPPFDALDKLTPNELLPPGRYEVRGWSGVASSTFTVENEVDTTPPARPEVQVAAFGKVGNMPSSITVSSTTANDSFLVLMGEPQTWEPVTTFGAGSNGTVTASDFPAGPQQLKAVRVDAAGNASEPVEVTATVPKDRACAVAPVLPLSLLALTLLRRRSLRR